MCVSLGVGLCKYEKMIKTKLVFVDSIIYCGSSSFSVPAKYQSRSRTRSGA